MSDSLTFDKAVIVSMVQKMNRSRSIIHTSARNLCDDISGLDWNDSQHAQLDSFLKDIMVFIKDKTQQANDEDVNLLLSVKKMSS